MPLIENKKGSQMYEWVSHMFSCMIGECPHNCGYCYVPVITKGNSRYKGLIRLDRKDLNADLGENNTIFICHTNDMFAKDVSNDDIVDILMFLKKYPKNKYVFQTKNPKRVLNFILPEESMVGTTIETNRDDLIKEWSKAPMPAERADAMKKIKDAGYETFITIEPIMDFDVDELFSIIESADPNWINIGADSKGFDLPEPGWDKVESFIGKIKNTNIEIKEKSNLDRLKPTDNNVVKILFKKDLAQKIHQNKKTCTSRLNQSGDVGDVFEVWYNGKKKTCKITNVEIHAAGYVRDNLWKEEGMNSPEEFENIIKEIYGKFDKMMILYVHFFKEL